MKPFDNTSGKPRFLLWFIILLTIFSVLINLPSVGPLSFKKNLTFKKGLDLAGGTSITLKADMSKIPSNRRDSALNSAKTVIERRINPGGASETSIKTSIAKGEYRLIVDLPGFSDLKQAEQLVGTTAELNFLEEETPSGKTATSAAAFKATGLTGKDLKETNVVFDPNSGKPQVSLVFTSEGGKKFAEITKKNIGKPIAIALDNNIISAPNVNEPILAGNAVISGSFTVEEARNLSNELNGGALPIPLSILQERVIGPTLGASSLLKSLFAGGLGIIVIIIFMIALYGKLGIVASVALILYTLFVLSIFKLSSVTPYGITLTLSGIAGFILSIGMAVDANILIFERIKEERRQGLSWHNSLELGFARAWTSIRDSNIASLITSFVLYQYGTGTVRGFALTLAIGVLVSMFSAIVVTRTFLRVIYR